MIVFRVAFKIVLRVRIITQIAMTYGNPSIKSSLEALREADAQRLTGSSLISAIFSNHDSGCVRPDYPRASEVGANFLSYAQLINITTTLNTSRHWLIALENNGMKVSVVICCCFHFTVFHNTSSITATPILTIARKPHS